MHGLEQESIMITLEARCRSGHYLAAVVPTQEGGRVEYRVLVFQHGYEVYKETEPSVEQAIETAKAYLEWQSARDLDS
jgi:hypothetical protein